MMKFALLGDDPVVLPFVRQIARRKDGSLTHATFLGGIEQLVLKIAPTTRLVDGWAELLSEDVTAVIVCGSVESIGAAARQLAAAGKTLIVFPQGTWETELIYELSLERDATGVRLIPISTILERPFFFWNDGQESKTPDDPILHLRMDRDVNAAECGELSANSLREYLLPDVGLLRFLGGEYHQVTAVKSESAEGGIVQATVTLTGEGLPDAIWTIRPVPSESSWRLTTTTQSGPEVSEGRSANKADFQPESSSSHQGTAIWAFVEMSLSNLDTRPDWTDLTRDFEILDAVRRSFAKRRTIDLHFETTSERSLFKTQMTAIGCGVLVLTLFAVVALLLIGSIFDARGPVEIKAANAETVFYEAEFVSQSSQLTSEGEAHWDRVEVERHDESIPILVERGESEELAKDRRDAIVNRLKNEGIANAEQRVESYELAGPGFELVMKIARILVFLPLFGFLGLQFLILVARPARSLHETEPAEDG